MLHEATYVLLALLLFFAAISDLRRYTIPNWLTLSVVITFAISLIGDEQITMMQMGWHLFAGALVLSIGLLLFTKNALGGGDVKLVAALSLWTGFAGLPRFLLLTSLAGGVFALVMLSIRHFHRDANQTLDHRLPYGVAIAIGGLDFCFQEINPIHRMMEIFTH